MCVCAHSRYGRNLASCHVHGAQEAEDKLVCLFSGIGLLAVPVQLLHAFRTAPLMGQKHVNQRHGPTSRAVQIKAEFRQFYL